MNVSDSTSMCGKTSHRRVCHLFGGAHYALNETSIIHNILTCQSTINAILKTFLICLVCGSFVKYACRVHNQLPPIPYSNVNDYSTKFFKTNQKCGNKKLLPLPISMFKAARNFSNNYNSVKETGYKYAFPPFN